MASMESRWARRRRGNPAHREPVGLISAAMASPRALALTTCGLLCALAACDRSRGHAPPDPGSARAASTSSAAAPGSPLPSESSSATAPSPTSAAPSTTAPAPTTGPLPLGDPPNLALTEGQRSPGTSIEVRLLPERRPGELLDTDHLRERVPKTRAIRGSRVAGPKGVQFVPHHAFDVAGLGPAPFFVVGSATGLWLHERRSLARRARLVAAPVTALAASPDGSMLAYAVEPGNTGYIEIIRWPSLAPVARFKRWAFRLQWSTDGRWLAIASAKDRAVLYDVQSRTTHDFNTHDDVHDVAPVAGRPGVAIVAGDSNQMTLVDIVHHKELATGPDMGRDVRAAVHDPVHGRLVAGGDANSIHWYSEKAPETPLFTRTFKADIYGLACCREGDVAVVFDERALGLLDENGEFTHLVGPVGGSWSGVYSGHLALLDDGDILGELGGEVYLWKPGVSLAQATEYGRVADEVSVTRSDTVVEGVRDDGTPLMRIPGGEPALDVEGEVLGIADEVQDFVRVLASGEGTRLVTVLLDNHRSNERWQMSLVPPGAPMSPWAPMSPECAGIARFERGRDDDHWITVSWRGDVCEVTRDALALKSLNARTDPKKGRIRWDSKAARYAISPLK